MRRGGGGWNSRRVLIDVSNTAAIPSADSTAEAGDYEEQSVFIPNNSFRSTVAPTNATSSSSTPAASEPVPPTSLSSTGLAGLLSYSDSDEEVEDSAKQADIMQAQSANATISLPASSPPGSLPDGWVAIKDESSGDTYYWHEATDVTSWDPPPPVKSKTAHSSEAAMASSNPPASSGTSGAQLPPLPAGWSEVIDPSSSDKYYWHEATDQTTWNRPTDAAATTSTDKTDAIQKPSGDAEVQLEQPQKVTSVAISSIDDSSRATSSSTVSASSSLLINALLTGVNIRLRNVLATPIPPLITSMPLEQSISPLMQLVIELRICEREWSNIQANTYVIDADIESKLLLRTLQRVTVDIDSVIEKEASWRQSQASRAADIELNLSAAHSTNASNEIATTAPVPVPPPRSGTIHPSRLGVVNPAVIGAPVVHHADNTKKRERAEGPASAAAVSGASKKPKNSASTSSSAAPSILHTSVGGLISKWKAVSEAAEGEAAAKKKERQLLQQAIDDSWKSSPSNVNMIPVGDWRAKIANQQQQNQ